MIKRLQKVGRRKALVLEKPIWEALGVEGDALVQVILTNGSLIITPVNPNAVSDEEFQACLERVIAKRGDVLRRLAEQ